MLGRMGELVREHGGVALGVAEGLEGRHLHVVRSFGVIGAGAAVADFNAGRGKEPIRRVEALHRGEGRGLRLGGVMRGQSVAKLAARKVAKKAVKTAAPGVKQPKPAARRRRRA
jgi:hypothetical protein